MYNINKIKYNFSFSQKQELYTMNRVLVLKYKNTRIRKYLVVDSMKNRIIVHNFESKEILEYTFDNAVKVRIYEDFYINLAEIL